MIEIHIGMVWALVAAMAAVFIFMFVGILAEDLGLGIHFSVICFLIGLITTGIVMSKIYNEYDAVIIPELDNGDRVIITKEVIPNKSSSEDTIHKHSVEVYRERNER